MHKIIAFQISFLLVLVPAYLFFSKPKPPAVLARRVAATSSPKPTAAPTPDPTNTPVPTPKPTLAPTPIPAPKYTSEQVSGFVESFANQYGVDPNVLRAIAVCETHFDPEAINEPYYGLFQFGPVTWQNLRVQMGQNPNTNLRLDAKEAARTAAYAISQGERAKWPHCNP